MAAVTLEGLKKSSTALVTEALKKDRSRNIKIIVVNSTELVSEEERQCNFLKDSQKNSSRRYRA